MLDNLASLSGYQLIAITVTMGHDEVGGPGTVAVSARRCARLDGPVDEPAGGRRSAREWDEQAMPVLPALRELLVVNNDVMQSLSRRLDVGITDAQALDHLITAREGLGVSELGRLLGIRSASATVLVDRLEQAGHVRREPHPTDRRRQQVVPTEHATEEIVGELHDMLLEIDAAARRLTPDQAEATLQFLQEVTAAMRRWSQR